MSKKHGVVVAAQYPESYLAELILEKGYEVHGIFRRASVFNTERIDHIFDKIQTYHSDLTILQVSTA